MTRKAQVQLAQDTARDATLGVAGVAETRHGHRRGVAGRQGFGDHRERPVERADQGAAGRPGVPRPAEAHPRRPVHPGHERGPSAGGSGQDNVYQFDGVNVTLPLFGTLSAEPASHDIAQVTVVKGGARAVDFDRVRRVLDRLGQQVGHQRVTTARSATSSRTTGMSADLDSGSHSRYEQDRTGSTANLGGPILKDRLYFYGSYYRPEQTRATTAPTSTASCPTTTAPATRASAS